MTIEQFAEAQGLPIVTRHTLPNKTHVYRLRDSESDDDVVGLPVFAIKTADGWRLTSPRETFKIMDALYGTDD